VLWATVGYTLAFGGGDAWIGNQDYLFMKGVGAEWKDGKPEIPQHTAYSIPMLTHMLFQGMFFIITPALICGAFAERMKFSTMVVFTILWGTLVYCPLCHWVWGGGVLAYKSPHAEQYAMGGALDFAGGTVVHISAGISALVAAWFLGPRKDYRRVPIAPHNVPLVLLGAGLLWFGWFGFNGGSALAANELAALAFSNTFLAPMATLVVWTLLDYVRTGRATAVGAATGIVVGLVAITPAAGFVSPASALLLGGLAAFPSYFAIALRSRTRVDDSLDVFAGHGVGGLTGALLTGVLAEKVWNSAGNDGLFFGNPGQLGVQALGCLSAALYAAIMTFLILKAMAFVTALRAVPRTEGVGMDVSQHGEEAYASGEGSILVPPEAAILSDTVPALTPQAASR